MSIIIDTTTALAQVWHSGHGSQRTLHTHDFIFLLFTECDSFSRHAPGARMRRVRDFTVKRPNHLRFTLGGTFYNKM